MPPFAANLGGDNAICFALLGLAGAVVASLLALVFAFFRRSRARFWAIATVACAGQFLFGLFPINNWNPLHVLGALVAVYPVTAAVGVTLLLAVIAYTVPLAREPGAEMATPTVRRNRRLVGLFLGVPALAGVIFACVLLIEQAVGTGKTEALMKGSQEVRLTRMRWEGQQRRADCTDPQVLRYFEERLRHNGGRTHVGASGASLL